MTLQLNFVIPDLFITDRYSNRYSRVQWSDWDVVSLTTQDLPVTFR